MSLKDDATLGQPFAHKGEVSAIILDAPAPSDVAGGVVDSSQARNFVQWNSSGKPTAESQSLMGDAIRAQAYISAVTDISPKLAGGLSDSNGRELLWFNTDGTLTQYSRRRTQNALTYPNAYIGAWTDSYGYGWLSGGTQTLDALTGIPVRQWSAGGQTSRRIASRQGGVRSLMTLTGNQIPASGAVTVVSWTANPIASDTNGSRDGWLAGVKGTLSYTPDSTYPTDDTKGTMTFTRYGTGPAVTVNDPTEFTCVEENDTDGWGIVFAFTNDRLGIPIHQTVSNITAMVQRYESQVKRVLVLGSFPSSNMTYGTIDRADFDGRRNAVKAATSGYWLDPYLDYYMTDQVFTDMGLTMTAQDLADRNTGLVPGQLRSDSIHLSTAGKNQLAVWVANRMVERGWIKTVL